MKKILLIFATFLVINSLFAQIPSGYYDSATGSGYTLKTQLYNIIKDHTVVSYRGLYNAYETTDNIVIGGQNKVYDMYSIKADGTADYYFNHADADQCGNYSVEGDCYNREHSMPQSWFNEASPMVSDLFHVYPTDGKVNGMRSNYPFGEVGTASWTSTNGSKKGTCSYSGYTGTVFEPIDEYKGDFARTYFYMATRYENLIDTWSSNSTTADDILNETEDQVFEDWFLNMIIEWHNNDPVSQKEIDRNDEVYKIQNNRNPFIDHPEYVCAIWGGDCGSTAPSISGITATPANPKSTETVSVSATITDDGSVSNVVLNWGTSTGNLANVINMTLSSGSTYTTTTNIPAQADGVTVYFEIEATDDEAEVSTSQEQSYTVSDRITILNEDFGTCPATDWVIYSSASNKDWTCESGYQSINAYGGDVASNDWLISPAQNLDTYNDEVLSFSSWTRYTDTSYPQVELVYSTNYSGIGDPAGAAWQLLSATWSAEDSQAWTESGNVDISGISGTQVYFAFHYTSSGTGGSTSSWWEIDNVKITGKENQSPLISNVSNNPTNPLKTQNVTISANITDADGTISSSNIHWGTVSGAYTNTDTMTFTGSGSVFTGTISAQAENTTVFYVVKAKDNAGELVTSEQYSYTVSDNQFPIIENISNSPTAPTDADDITISAIITDADGTVSSAKLKWGTSKGSYANEVSMTNTGDTFSGIITAQTGGTVVNYVIEAFDESGGSNRSDEKSFVVNTTGNNPPVISNLLYTPTDPESSEDVQVTATITDSDGSISSASIKWGTVSGDYTNEIIMTNTGDLYSGTIPQQEDNIHVYFIIIAKDAVGGYTESTEQDYLVNDPNVLPVISNVSIDPTNPTSSDDVRVNAVISDSDGSISSASIKWGTSTGNYTNTASMTGSGNDYLGSIPKQADGTRIYFIVYAEDNEGGTQQSSEETYTVSDPNVLPVISNITIDPASPTSSDDVRVNAVISDSDGSISSASIKWGTNTGSYTNTISMSGSVNDYLGTIPKQTDGVTIYFVIFAEDNEGGTKQSDEESYTVFDPNQLPEITDVTNTPVSPDNTNDVTITASITDSDGTIQSAKISWGTSTGSLSNNVYMSNTSNNTYSGVIPAQTAGTTVYYVVSATDNSSETAISAEQSYTVVVSSGIKTVELAHVKIYPNPTQGNLTIDINDLDIKSVSIYNLNGEKIAAYSQFNGQQLEVDLSPFPKGLYFIRIDNENDATVRKTMLK